MGLFKRKDSNRALRQADENDTVDEIVTGKSKVRAGFSKVVGAFQFDRHRKIERRRLYFILAALTLAFGWGLGFWHAHVVAKENALKTTAYDSEVSFSKTQNTNLKLGKVTASKDLHRAFIPITFSSMQQLSTEAKSYMIMVTASEGDMHYNPTGRLVLFGNSGRGIIVIESPTKIQNQPLTIYIRNDKDLSSEPTSSDETAENYDDSKSLDDMMSKYDLLYFKVNPGAKGIKKLSKFDKGKTEVSSFNLYKQFYANPDLEKIKDSNQHQRKDIRLKTRIAKEYKNRLVLAGYKVPAAPKWMKDDWRPYDFVNPKTGKVGNGKNKVKANYNTTNSESSSNSNDPDNVQYPDDLERKDGTGSLVSDAQKQDTTDSPAAYDNASSDDTDNVGGNNQSPTEIWSSLQDAWNSVHADKRAIYVQNNSVKYTVKSALETQTETSSVGPKSRFKVLSKVVVQNN